VVGTVLFAVNTSLRFALYAPELDIAVHALGTFVCLTAAALSFARSREQGGSENLLQASAFLVLAAANLANAIVVITRADEALGLTLAEPGQLPLYFWAAARLSMAGLLAAGAFPALASRVDAERWPRVVLLLPTALIALMVGGLWLARDMVPVLVDPATLRQLVDESFSAAPSPGINPGILVLDGSAAVLLALGAFGYARSPRGTHGIPREYLVVGLVFATFSQIHFVLYPAVFSGLVSSGDALRIAFYVILVAGIHAGTRADLQALHHANSRLRSLAAAEADRSTIAERARLARELHDGLAQDLWTAKLEFDRLSDHIEDPRPETAAQMTKVRHAIDAAAAEARDAVATLRTGFDAGLSFADELPRRLDAFADQTGYLVDLELDPAASRLPGVFAADVLRIVDEALHNVHKHADATRIRLRVAQVDGQLQVTIVDNGRGFSETDAANGHGLTGMRERAELLGGRLEIHSGPGDGTAVRLVIPASLLPG
jgi:signal transduction histidine kinase